METDLRFLRFDVRISDVDGGTPYRLATLEEEGWAMRKYSLAAAVASLVIFGMSFPAPRWGVANLYSLRLPFGVWRRATLQPILRPKGHGFESAGVFNPAVVRNAGRIVMLYRAQNRQGISSLGFATSADGLHFKARAKPVFFAQADYERGGGVEDPRIVKIDGTFYMTYTGYHNESRAGAAHHDAQLCLATSPDLIHWTRHGVIMPAYKGAWNVGWTKSGAILDKRINGRYWMYYLGDAKGQGSQMGVASSTGLLDWKDALDHPVLSSRPGKFDSRVVEPGPPPILLKDGILLIYNGTDDHLVYSTGWVLFDRQNPTRVLARASKPIFTPQTPWEKNGQTPNVVFVEGMVRKGGKWFFYYGGADKYIGAAEADVQNISSP